MPTITPIYRIAIAAAGAFALCTWLTLPSTGTLFTIRAFNPVTGAIQFTKSSAANQHTKYQRFTPSSFDADDYVNRHWTRVTHYVDQHAIPISKLLQALSAHRAQAEKKYGITQGVSGGYSFIVTGTGTVTDINTKSPVGTMTITLATSGNSALQATKTMIMVGPLVVSNALRNSLPFISFNDFTNQVQYANVSDSLNNRALAAALAAGSKWKHLLGKKIKFWGAFTFSSISEIDITPIKVTPLKGVKS